MPIITLTMLVLSFLVAVGAVIAVTRKPGQQHPVAPLSGGVACLALVVVVLVEIRGLGGGDYSTFADITAANFSAAGLLMIKTGVTARRHFGRWLPRSADNGSEQGNA